MKIKKESTGATLGVYVCDVLKYSRKKRIVRFGELTKVNSYVPNKS